MSQNLANKDTCRKVFDDLSLHVISLLEAHPAACDVKFQDHLGVTQSQISTWEAANHPYVLPDDFKAFLAISNGVAVRWSLCFRGEMLPFGIMHINQLEEVKSLLVQAKGSSGLELGQATIGEAVAFDLDSECAHGKVALYYPELDVNGSSNESRKTPQVWFQDLSCRWHFIADSFTDYFRLLAMHLGVPQWQYAFTDLGLDSIARHWLALFCPERLAVADEEQHLAHLHQTAPRRGSSTTRDCNKMHKASSKVFGSRSSPKRRARDATVANSGNQMQQRERPSSAPHRGASPSVGRRPRNTDPAST